MNFVIISSHFGERERKLLTLNLGRIQSIISDFRIIYVLNVRPTQSVDCFTDRVTFVELLDVTSKSSCAALNRVAGWQYINENLNPLPGAWVVFLDGDMVIARPYLKYLHGLTGMSNRPILVCSQRIDFRDGVRSKRLVRARVVKPELDKRQNFETIYGAFAVCNIDQSLMMITHDHEEQWFLTRCKINYGEHLRCLQYSEIGIFHFDKWNGGSRIFRTIFSSRGVGFWQGLFSGEYGLYGMIQVLKDNVYFMSLPLLIVLHYLNPWLIILPFLHLKTAKRICWLCCGLMKLPFYKRPIKWSLDKL